MPYLGDYLGQLLAEISMARMQADLETVRLAELYAAHPLLRTMPVPHMRLPEVDLDIPVLIKESEEPRAGQSTRGGVPLADLRRKFNEVLARHLSKISLTLSDADRKGLRVALDERLSLHGVPVETGVDVLRIADDLTTTALRFIAETRPTSIAPEPAIPPQFLTEIKEAVRIEFLKLRTPPPRLMVLVTTAEIREAGGGENITRLRLKVSEAGMEWTMIESEGMQRNLLVPE